MAAHTTQGPGQLVDALKLLARSCHAPAPAAAMLGSMMDCMLTLMGAERGFILLARGRPKGKKGPVELAPVVTRKVDIENSDRFSHSVASQVFASGQPRLIRDTAADHQVSGQASILEAAIRSILAAPLLEDGVPVGVIYLDSHSRTRVFTPEDQELLVAASEHVALALANSQLRESLDVRVARLQGQVEQEVRREYDTRQIVGRSPPMMKVLETLELLAPQTTSALILGESGTGKELVARALHDLSPRKGGPFVAVNCMALAAGLLESELFGHEKGAFTGASESRPGRFELADEGTIFLDEIGELEPGVQVKLLRVLQERVVERVGSTKSRPVRVRVVCATHADLPRMIREGKFREDLYYRIAVFPILLPPLRERKADVADLALHFVSLLSRRMGRQVEAIAPDALQAMVDYHWPGNIRELKNVVERALVLERSDRITLASLPFGATAGAPPASAPAPVAKPGQTFADAREAFERQYILECLARHGQNITQAAEELDVPRSTVYRKLRGWGLAPKESE